MARRKKSYSEPVNSYKRLVKALYVFAGIFFLYAVAFVAYLIYTAISATH